MSFAEYELYKRVKLLGEGSYGKAFLCQCVLDGSLCVVKEVDLNSMSESEKRDTINPSTTERPLCGRSVVEGLKKPKSSRLLSIQI
jgi:NIMA (never in mitosis gene a)-related kinase